MGADRQALTHMYFLFTFKYTIKNKQYISIVIQFFHSSQIIL
jgi:hypothetical protein